MGEQERLEAVLVAYNDRIEQTIRQGEEQLKNGREPQSLADESGYQPQEDT